jgi:anti-anti-sigma factor
MKSRDCLRNTVVIDLPPEPEVTEALETAITMARQHPERDMVIDFTRVSVVTSASLSKLLQLRKIVRDTGGSLVLRNMTPLTSGIFTVTGLDELFEFGDRS